MYYAITQFSALTHWGVDYAKDFLNKRPNITATPNWTAESTGILTISAPTEDAVDSAVSWITCHSLFGRYFKQVGETSKREEK